MRHAAFETRPGLGHFGWASPVAESCTSLKIVFSWGLWNLLFHLYLVRSLDLDLSLDIMSTCSPLFVIFGGFMLGIGLLICQFLRSFSLDFELKWTFGLTIIDSEGKFRKFGSKGTSWLCSRIYLLSLFKESLRNFDIFIDFFAFMNERLALELSGDNDFGSLKLLLEINGSGLSAFLPFWTIFLVLKGSLPELLPKFNELCNPLLI